MKTGIYYIIIIIIIFIFQGCINKTYNINIPESMGKVTVINGDEKKEYTNPENIQVSKKSLIVTEKETFLVLKIGERAFIQPDGNSQIEVIKIDNNKKKEKVELFLKKGGIFSQIYLISDDSEYKIHTSLADFSVKDTKFRITYEDNNDIKIYVRNGKVEIGNFFKIPKDFFKSDKIEEPSLAKIEGINKSKFIIEGEDNILLPFNELNSFNIELNQLINKNKNIDKELIENEINLLIDKSKVIMKNIFYK